MTVSVRRLGARLITGIVITAAFVVGAAVAVTAPWPIVTREPIEVAAHPEPTASVISCVGPVLATGRDLDDAAALGDAALQEVSVSAGWTEGEVQSGVLEPADVVDGTGPDAFTALPLDGVRTDIAAAGSAAVADEDLRGFAASTCAPALMESWLVGGSGLTGASDLVVLSNPGGVPAEVDLTVYGAEGADVPAAGAGILVAPRSQRVVPLAAIALGLESPVVRVNATAAPVQAALQTSITRTLVPAGLDQVGTTAAPAMTQTVPAFTVTRAPGESGASEVTTQLRVLAPSQAGRAVVTVIALEGGTVPAPIAVDLVAGSPLELELSGLEPGAYSLRIDAETPVVTALWQTTGSADTVGSGEGVDFAWHTAAAPIDVPSPFAVADGPAPVLTVVNDDASAARVILTDGGGAESALDVPAGGHVRVTLRAAEAYLLTPRSGVVRAAVTYVGDGALAGYDVVPADAAAEPVVVFPQ